MAKINNIQLKNIKKKGNLYKCRIDMDNEQIARLLFTLENNIFRILRLTFDINSQKFMNSDISSFDFTNEVSIVSAVKKDNKNEAEFNSRMSAYFLNSDDENVIFDYKEKFLSDLYKLYTEEKTKRKANATIDRNEFIKFVNYTEGDIIDDSVCE